MTLRILHTADWHLGLTFRRFDDADRKLLSRERLSTVDRILQEARQQQVDAVLCAGDLFDVPRPEAQVWQALAELFEQRNPNCPVYLLPGNHDHFSSDTIWAPTSGFRQSLPPNFHVVERVNQQFQINDEAVLVASACESAAGADNLAAQLPQRDPDDQRIRIAMIHGQTFDMEGYQNNFPVDVSAAGQLGYDYVALGDTHAFRKIAAGGTLAVYPGTPEATRFSESDYGFVSVVTFADSRRPQVQAVKVGRWQWLDQVCETLDDLRQLVTSPDLGHTVLRLNLQMDLNLKEYDQALQWLNKLQGTDVSHAKVGVLQVDTTGLRQATVEATEFPAELPDLIRKTIDLIQASENPVVANRALWHLYQEIHRDESTPDT